MRKVCFDITPLLTSSRFRGIGSNYCLRMARAFAKAGPLLDGIDLQLLLGNTLRIEPCNEALLSSSSMGAEGWVWARPLYYSLKQTAACLRLLDHRVDLYHSGEPKGTARPPRCKIVLTCHDLIPIVLRHPFHPPLLPRRMRGPLERLRYRLVDHVIAISHCTRRDLVRHLDFPEDRISVIYQGVDTELYHPRREENEPARVAALLGTDRPYFLYVGGFDSRKQVLDLVEVFGRHARDLDEVLVLVGSTSPNERKRIEERIHAIGARGRVLLLGFVPNATLAALYRGATAHIMPSQYEGFGATIVEAFACGCPVVALSNSSLLEIAEGAALLLPNEPLHTLGGSLFSLSSDDGLRSRLRQAGLNRAARFTWESCAAETIAVYRNVLGE
jgi:glycosyltransferase involved in cell wall biosynthesis